MLFRSVIITGRGGGSIEDLWAFNEEVVARAIFACNTPIVSAVGHEPDVTISDFVADVRAATPSHAAEIAVCDAQEVKATLQSVQARMTKMEIATLKQLRLKLDAIAQKRIMQSPYEYLNERSMMLAMLEQRLSGAMMTKLTQKRRQFVHAAATLDALSPLKVLSRGYSMVQGDEGVVKSAAALQPGTQLTVTFADGSADCTVQSVKKTGE